MWSSSCTYIAKSGRQSFLCASFFRQELMCFFFEQQRLCVLNCDLLSKMRLVIKLFFRAIQSFDCEDTFFLHSCLIQFCFVFTIFLSIVLKIRVFRPQAVIGRSSDVGFKHRTNHNIAKVEIFKNIHYITPKEFLFISRPCFISSCHHKQMTSGHDYKFYVFKASYVL